MSEQFVYAIGSEAHGFVKIGTSRDITARLAALQTSSPYRLMLLWQHPGGWDVERHLHAHFVGRRAHGEWFDFSGADPAAEIALALDRPRSVDFRLREPAAQRASLGIPPDSELGMLLAEIMAIEDPGECGRMATEALDALRWANVELSRIRREGVQELKDQGFSFKTIGEMIGPGDDHLHPSRIQQILKGGKTGRWAKVARATDERSPES